MLMMYSTSSSILAALLLLCLCFLALAPTTLAQDGETTAAPPPNKKDAVTILGLGNMGTAVLQCLVDAGHPVHAWNRGERKRQAVAEIATVVHASATAAVQASATTLILIDDWAGTVQLLNDIRMMDMESNGEPKQVVVFSTYTPTDIQKVLLQHQQTTTNTNVTIIGGAIVGVPQTICTPQALLLTSSPVPVLEPVGRTVAFSGHDVGLAALANMALILVITFGVAGQELALLIIRQYPGMDQHFLDTYIPLAVEIGPAYTKMLLPAVSKAATTREYERSYVPVGVFRKVLRMHATFMEELGIKDDTFLASYLRYLEQVANEKHGPVAWTELATNLSETSAATTTPADEEMAENVASEDEL